MKNTRQEQISYVAVYLNENLEVLGDVLFDSSKIEPGKGLRFA